MKKLMILGAALIAFAAVSAPAMAADPLPFPAPQIKQVFIATQTVAPDGTMSSYFAPGSTVVFRSYAVDPKTRSIVDAKMVKYFYVSITGEPNTLKFKYDPSAPGASKGLPWTASWTVPATFPQGTVAFKVLLKLTSKRQGQFVQMPVSTSMLTIMKNPPAPPPQCPNAGAAGTAQTGQINLSLYVDSVAGTRPHGVPPRPIGFGSHALVRWWSGNTSKGSSSSRPGISELSR